jgi:hypothetical protein
MHKPPAPVNHRDEQRQSDHPKTEPGQSRRPFPPNGVAAPLNPISHVVFLISYPRQFAAPPFFSPFLSRQSMDKVRNGGEIHYHASWFYPHRAWISIDQQNSFQLPVGEYPADNHLAAFGKTDVALTLGLDARNYFAGVL